LKPAILDLIPKECLPGRAGERRQGTIWDSISPSAKHKKATRGFANNITARLLCPTDHLRAFDANPLEYVLSCPSLRSTGTLHHCLQIRTIEKLKNGTLPRLDRAGVPKFPSFMYDEDMMEPGKVMSGLFRGPLLVAVGPSFPWCVCFANETSRSSSSSSFRGAPREGRRRRVEGVLPKSTGWGMSARQPSAIQFSRCGFLSQPPRKLTTSARHGWASVTWPSGRKPTAVSTFQCSTLPRAICWISKEVKIRGLMIHLAGGIGGSILQTANSVIHFSNSQVINNTTGEAQASRDNEAPPMLETLDLERRQRMAATPR
jgi:hypothetical protein